VPNCGYYPKILPNSEACTSPEKMDTKLWLIDTLSGRSSFRTLHFVQGRNPGRVSSQKQPTAWKKTKNGYLLFMTSQPSTGRICEQRTRSKASQLHASSMTVDLASSRMSCGRTPYAHLMISMQPYLVLIQRCSAGGKKYSAGSQEKDFPCVHSRTPNAMEPISDTLAVLNSGREAARK
jgi:hypothetical protein